MSRDGVGPVAGPRSTDVLADLRRGRIQGEEARLRAAGVDVEEGSPEETNYRRVLKMLTFKDPSGMRLEAFYGLDVTVDRRFHSPRPIAGFKTGDMGLGHYVVTVDDAEESLRFYRDILGFRISTLAVSRETPGQPIRMAFFHVNPRHHSMAFNARQDPPGGWATG